VDLRGPDYNTNVQVSKLEQLIKWLPKPSSAPEPATPPRKRPRTAKQLNAEQTAELIIGYQSGTTLRELGKQFGVHSQTASAILRRNGITMRSNGLSEEGQREAERLYASGLSLRRVGERLSVDGETVRQVLRRRMIKLRTRHG
jgi:lambda repressor-like predicted transcriptional regulator